MSCERCGAKTAEACNDKGCFFFESGADMPPTSRSRLEYRYHTFRRVERSMSQAVFAQAYEDAAAWLEQNPNYDASTAILKATDHLPEMTARLVGLAFFESFGCWCGDDEGVLMLCFAAAFARTDRLL